MLDYDILSKKPTIKLVNNGEENTCIDLLTETFDKNIQYSIGGDVIIINEYYVARPDLVSFAVYGDDKYADILCKINGISNPFELNENMLIYLPPIDTLQRLTKPKQRTGSVLVNNENGYDSNDSSSKQIWTEKRNINKNKSNIELQHSQFIKLNNENRTPSDVTVSDKNYIIDKSLGFVIY